MLIAAALVIFAASSFVLSTMPLFLALFIFALAGITLSIIAIVRTAVYRGPWFFYIAAGVSIIYGAMTLLGGIGACPHARRAGVPQCRAAADPNRYVHLRPEVPGTMDKLTGTSSSKLFCSSLGGFCALVLLAGVRASIRALGTPEP